MQYSRSIPRQATSSTRSSVSATGRSPSPNSSNLLSFNENEVLMAEHGILISSCRCFFVMRRKYLIQFCCACCRLSSRLLFAILLYVSIVKHFKRFLVFIYICLIFFEPLILFYKYRWCGIWHVDIVCSLQMEGIPSKVRTLKMNLMLGKLYRISRNIRSAAVCYKECLRYNISSTT